MLRVTLSAPVKKIGLQRDITVAGGVIGVAPFAEDPFAAGMGFAEGKIVRGNILLASGKTLLSALATAGQELLAAKRRALPPGTPSCVRRGGSVFRSNEILHVDQHGGSVAPGQQHGSERRFASALRGARL